MGKIIDINTGQPLQHESRRNERIAAVTGAAILTISAYFIGHEHGANDERHNQVLEVPKACFSADRMASGRFKVLLNGNKDRLLLTVNGQAQGADETLPEALSKDGPLFEVIC